MYHNEAYYELNEKDELMSHYDLVEASELPDKEQCLEALDSIKQGLWGISNVTEEDMERHMETLYDQVLNMKFDTSGLIYAPSNNK